MSTAHFEPHFLEDMGYAVADCGSRSEREVDNAEGHAEELGRACAYELTHTGYLESGLLDYVRYFVN